jgi:hypothetical protein
MSAFKLKKVAQRLPMKEEKAASIEHQINSIEALRHLIP